MLQTNSNKNAKPGERKWFLFSFPLSVMHYEGFQHINCLIILNYKKIIGIFYYRQAEKPEKQCVCDTQFQQKCEGQRTKTNKNAKQFQQKCEAIPTKMRRPL
jgi:hypothetical protein